MLLADLAHDYRTCLEAYSVLERAAEDPERTQTRRRLVAVAVMIGRYQDARHHLQEFLLKDFPKDGELWDQVGRCCLGMNEYQLAADNFKKAIDLSPALVLTYRQLTEVLRLHLMRPEECGPWMEKLRAKESEGSVGPL